MRILRVFLVNGRSWMSDGALWKAIESDEPIKIITHGDVWVRRALVRAMHSLRKLRETLIAQSWGSIMWCLVAAGIFAWPPVWDFILMEIRACIYIVIGLYFLANLALIVKWKLELLEIKEIPEVVVQCAAGDPKRIPPIVAYRENEYE